MQKQELLRHLPKIDELISLLPETSPYSTRLRAAREAVSSWRTRILADEAVEAESIVTQVANDARQRLIALESHSLRPVVNATGVVIHTNLGRSLLPDIAFDALCQAAGRYSNLEYDLVKGERGSRYSHVEDLLCELTGAEAALVVNNNAAATLIVLESLAKDREVVVSRGELVEIGGSFRIPDVMAKSGAILKEIGATNRTHFRDYESAISDQTVMLMKVHQSNFSIVGFTKSVPLRQIAELSHSHNLIAYEDLGSGTLVDFSRYGLPYEPTVQESLKAGADVVSFSGDKLLGGPQAGIIVGSKQLLDKIKTNPLNRAMRIDKLTLSALESILRLYREPSRAVKLIPTLSMLTVTADQLLPRARGLAKKLNHLNLANFTFSLHETVSKAGGGSLPLSCMKSWAVVAESKAFSAAELEKRLRDATPPVIVRIENNRIVMDIRTVLEKDTDIIISTFKGLRNDA